jgi:cytochrome b561
MPIQRYTKAAVVLHWLIASGIIINVALAWLWPHHLPDDVVRPAIDVHKSIGVTVLGLAVMRLLWRLGHRPPPLPGAYAKWERTASHVTHVLLYVLIFAMPLTGWIMDSAWKDAPTHPISFFGTAVELPRIAYFMHLEPGLRDRVHDIFGEAHVWASYLLYFLFTAHVAGALKHQWLDREAEVQRMWFGR